MTPSNPNNVPTNMGPNMESGPGPADPGLSSANAAYTGSGYNPVRGGTGKVGTINPGLNIPVALAGAPAQVRFFIGADGNLYAVGNQTAQTYLITGPISNPPPLISVYNPTK